MIVVLCSTYSMIFHFRWHSDSGFITRSKKNKKHDKLSTNYVVKLRAMEKFGKFFKTEMKKRKERAFKVQLRRDKAKLKFLDHVIMTWLNRAARSGSIMRVRDFELEIRAGEAASALEITKVFDFYDWLPPFKKLMKEADHKSNRRRVVGFPSLIIADIVEEEWKSFFGKERPHMRNTYSDSESGCDLIEDKRMKYSQVIRVDSDYGQVKAFDDRDQEKRLMIEATSKEETSKYQEHEIACNEADTFDEQIQTYDEALDCLKLLEGYAILTVDFMALHLINQIEKILTSETIS